MSGFSQSATQLTAALEAGLEQISNPIDVVFTQYIRYVLPLDGFVFWLRTQQTTFRGSVHLAAVTNQEEAATYAMQHVVFSTTQPIKDFDEPDPQAMWVGTFPGSGDEGAKFSFSRQGYFSPKARLYHYEGDAVNAFVANQLVDVGSQLPADTLVVSNSLPAWLAIPKYSPVWLVPNVNAQIPIFPSFLVPPNIVPPYGVVHIMPETTRAMQMAPLITTLSSHHMLTTERVRVTLYGLTNTQALDWMDLVFRYSVDTSTFGLMGEPTAVKDMKTPQPELGIIVMEKTLEFEIAYNQYAMRDTALQLILQAQAAVSTAEFVTSQERLNTTNVLVTASG